MPEIAIAPPLHQRSRNRVCSIAELVQDYRDRLKRGKVSPEDQALVKLGIMRKVGSQYKVNSAIALAEELLEQSQQAVIFGEFKESVNAVYSRFAECAELLTGDTPQDERQEMRQMVILKENGCLSQQFSVPGNCLFAFSINDDRVAIAQRDEEQTQVGGRKYAIEIVDPMPSSEFHQNHSVKPKCLKTEITASLIYPLLIRLF